VDMRPKPLNENIRTEIEILIHVNDSEVCIIDAKNYKSKFPLSASLASHMGSEYIPNYQGYENKSVSYFGYVTANDFSGEHNLKKISSKANAINNEINSLGAIFSAKALLGFLDYCLEHEIEREERTKYFLNLFKSSGYRNTAEMFNMIDSD